jgi:S1-C subfamily serine protease
MNQPSVPDTDKLQSRLGRVRERMSGLFPFASGVLAALLALILFNFLFPGKQPMTERAVSDAIASAMASATPRPAFSVQVYQKIQPSIVYIEVESVNANGSRDKGLGTGVIFNDFADILTSLHVVSDARDIQVTFADGSKSSAFVLASSPENDIAVLRAVEPPLLFVPATLGSPGSMQVGDDVYVVGNPFGLYSSMSSGVISGFDRVFRPKDSDLTIEGLIQFDAAANPGNSGGPLLNRNGHVIGIVTGIITPTDQSFFVGIGFAVPINTAASGGAGSPPY